MATWSIDLLALSGGSVSSSNVAFRSGVFNWTADGSGTFQIDLSKAQGSSGLWIPGQRRVALKKSGTRKFCGWLENLSRSGVPSTGVGYTAAGRGLGAHLAQRVVHGDFSQVEQNRTDIAQALIDHINSQDDDKSNFTDGATTGVAGTCTRYYGDGDIIADAISELANAKTVGFDWEIDENGELNTWAPSRGSAKVHTLHDSDCISWELEFDVSELASYATGLGNANDNTPMCGPPVEIVDDSGFASTYGRKEVVVETDTNVTGEMDAIAGDEIRARSASRLQLTSTWIEGRGLWSFGSVWLGDTVTGALGSEFGGNTSIRCIGIQLTLEPGATDSEFVQMTWEAAA